MTNVAPFTPSSVEGYYLIEEYSRYAINKDGALLDLKKNSHVDLRFESKTGRAYYLIRSDDRKWRQVKRYRLMMIAMSERPDNYRKLTVNHIDTNCLNDTLSNLEWLSDLDNIEHARKRGLYTRHAGPAHCVVEVMDIFTKRVTRYNTKREALSALGIIKETLNNALHDRKQPTVMGKYLCRVVGDDDFSSRLNAVFRTALLVRCITDDTIEIYPTVVSFVHAKRLPKHDVYDWVGSGGEVMLPDGKLYTFNPTVMPWRHIPDPEAELLNYGTCKTVLLKDVHTGEIREFPKLQELAAFVGASPPVMSGWVFDTAMPLRDGRWLAKLKTDARPWRQVSDPAAEQRAFGNNRYVHVTEQDGTIREFVSAKAAADHYGLNPTTVNWRLKTDGQKVYADGTRWAYVV